MRARAARSHERDPDMGGHAGLCAGAATGRWFHWRGGGCCPISKSMDPVSGIGQVELSSQVSIAVVRKAMDSQQEEAAALIEMIKQAGDAGSSDGASSDGHIDVYA